MKERDPSVLLPQLHKELQNQGAPMHVALFVPPDSQYAFLPSSKTSALVAAVHQDLSWQTELRGVWQQCEAAAAAADPAAAEQGLVGKLPPLPEVPGKNWVSWALRDGVGEQLVRSIAVERFVTISQAWCNYNLKKLPLSSLRQLMPVCSCGLFLLCCTGVDHQDLTSSNAAVVSCMADVLSWLQQAAAAQPDIQLQVLVTGSLYLVGDCLAGLQQQPS
jgi:hypothetical protein